MSNFQKKLDQFVINYINNNNKNRCFLRNSGWGYDTIRNVKVEQENSGDCGSWHWRIDHRI